MRRSPPTTKPRQMNERTPEDPEYCVCSVCNQSVPFEDFTFRKHDRIKGKLYRSSVCLKCITKQTRKRKARFRVNQLEDDELEEALTILALGDLSDSEY